MKNETYLMINGQKIELTAEQKKQLGIVEEKNCFDRMVMIEYYYMNSYGDIIRTDDAASSIDDHLYSVANYCTDKDLIYQRSLHETLNRLLWRYSMIHNEDKINWNDSWMTKWYIYYDIINKRYDSDYHTTGKTDGVIYFHTKGIALSAIEKIVKPFMEEHPEFVW